MSNDVVVVVGSGPSGAGAAAQLASRGVRVVILDAGPREPGGWVVKAGGNTLYRRFDNSLYSTDRLADDSDQDVYWASSLSLGGLSNYWTSAVPRFAPDDFTDGARLDERYRWPVSYDDVEPWYGLAEADLVVTAGNPIAGVPDNEARYRGKLPADWRAVRDANANGGEPVGLIPLAKGKRWMVARRAAEYSSYHCVVAPLERDGRVELVRGAHVSHLEWSATEGRVVRAVYVDEGGQEQAIECSAVVLAAGTVDSTMIALRSRSEDFPDGLGNAHGLVGRYLHDHPRDWWVGVTDQPLTAPAHPVYVAREPFEDSEPLLATSLTIGLTALRNPRQRLRTFYGGRTDRFGVQVFGTMVPRPEIGVSLSGDHESDPRNARPTVRLSYEQPEVTNVTAARERFRHALAAAGIGVELPDHVDDLSPGSSVHMSGTMRMHDDPQFGVIDRWSRMHDAPNVIVADMSSFTTGPEKNPTLTSMALARRAADRLADDLGHPPASSLPSAGSDASGPLQGLRSKLTGAGRHQNPAGRSA